MDAASTKRTNEVSGYDAETVDDDDESNELDSDEIEDDAKDQAGDGIHGTQSESEAFSFDEDDTDVSGYVSQPNYANSSLNASSDGTRTPAFVDIVVAPASPGPLAPLTSARQAEMLVVSTDGSLVTSDDSRASTPKLNEETKVNVKDWNAEFQVLVEGMESLAPEHQYERFKLLDRLVRDFRHTACLYAKVIISEAQLPPALRTIKPVSIGGTAGGEKFITHGILFKFALDWKGIYGDDERAMKAAGLELHGLMAYYDADVGLHVPLICLIDYKGFRIVAESILPVDASTLVYGSRDAGVTVRHDDAEMNAKMVMAASRINLKEHRVGRFEVPLCSPVDIEGHRGMDGRLYLLDFARTFPPEYFTSSSWEKSCNLYKQLRPELVKSWYRPLSSDALSAFGKSDRVVHDMEVKEATEHLVHVVIPAHARWLNENPPETLGALITGMHMKGINVRYLGHLRTHLLENESISLMCLHEMIARRQKSTVTVLLREIAKQQSTVVEEPLRAASAKFFNLVIGNSAKSEGYWKETVKTGVLSKFKTGLTEEERAPGFDLRQANGFNLRTLMLRVQELSGVRLSKEANMELSRRSQDVRLASIDIAKFKELVKDMSLVAHAQAVASAQKAVKYQNSSSKDRYFQTANDRFERALESSPNNVRTLNAFGDSLVNQALSSSSNEQALQLLDTARAKFESSHNWQSLTVLGGLIARKIPRITDGPSLGKWYKLAFRCYANACSMVHSDVTPWYHWANLLCVFWLLRRDPKLPVEAGEKYRRALALSPSLHQKIRSWAMQLEPVDLAAVVCLCRSSPDLSSLNWKKSPFMRSSLIPLIAEHCRVVELLLKDCYSVNYNHIVAAAPYLSWLRRLNLKRCSIGSLDVLASNCPHLEVLDISKASTIGHPIKDKDLITLAALENLKELHVRSCRDLSDKSFEMIAEKGRLRALSLANCYRVTDFTLNALAAHCTKLKRLDISNCICVSGPALRKLCKRTLGLKKLLLAGCTEISGDALKAVAQCTQLETLNLSGIGVLSEDLRPIAENCQMLNNLTLSRNSSVDITIVQAFLRNRRMCKIDFSECPNLSDASLAYFASHMKRLSALIAGGSRKAKQLRFTDESLLKLGGRDTLRKLKLSHCPELTDHSVSQVLRASPNLRDVTLSHCPSITDRVVATMVESCKHLQKVDLSGCLSLTACDEFRHCDHLEDVVLARCKNLAPSSIRLIPSLYPLRIVKLVLDGCAQLTDDVLLEVTTNCLNLTVLSLSKCNLVSSNAFASISTCTRLEKLGVAQTKIDDAALSQIASACGGIYALDVHSCARLSDASLSVVAEKLRELKTLNLNYCQEISDSFARVGENLPALKRLSAAWCRVSEEIASKISLTCKSLRVVEFDNNSQISDRVISDLSTRARFLEHLSLNKCVAIGDAAMSALAKNSYYLALLAVSGCPRVSSAGLLMIAEMCSQLHTLEAKEIAVGDQVVVTVAKHGASLRKLAIGGKEDSEITDQSVDVLAHMCNNITFLDLSGCRRVSARALTAVATNCARLEHFEFGDTAVDEESKFRPFCSVSDRISQRCLLWHGIAVR